MTQQNLFCEPEKTIKEKAEEWIENNPEIYQLFVKFAFEESDNGKPFGISWITERVRRTANISWKGKYKICNSHRAYIARRLIKDYPRLADFIKVNPTKF